jgi:hypothetical protein
MFRAVLWHVLMLLWLAALGSGMWWIWPNFFDPAARSDLLAGLLWLVVGGGAWWVAFDLGRERYWRRR